MLNNNSDLENIENAERFESSDTPSDQKMATEVQEIVGNYQENANSTREEIDEISDYTLREELNEKQEKLYQEATKTVEDFAVETSAVNELDETVQNEGIETRKRYEEMNSNEKEEEVMETSRRFRNDLGLGEDEEVSEEGMNIKKRKYLEATGEYYENQEQVLVIEQELIKLAREGENLDLENIVDLEKFQDFLKEFARKQGELVSLLKYEYLLGEKNIPDFAKEDHIERMVLIETLEEMQRLAQKDLEDMTPQEKRNLIGILGKLGALAGLGALAVLAAKLAESATTPTLKGLTLKGIETGALGAKAGVAGGLAGKVGLAGLVVLILERLSVEDIEKITGVKSPWWIKKLDKRNNKED